MHSYLKCIGFENLDRSDLRVLLDDVKAHPEYQSISGGVSGEKTMDLRKDYAKNLGISVTGVLDPKEGFVQEYYYPYCEGTEITSYEDVEIVKNTDRDTYQGIIDDPKLGIDLVFFIIDEQSLVQADYEMGEPVNHGGVRMSGLADKGSILLPLDASIQPVESMEKVIQRSNLMRAAKDGDHEAIEELSEQDMEQYNEIGERIETEDMLTILSTYIMPQGIESDKYSVLGDIVGVTEAVNQITMKRLYILKILINGMFYDVCINANDLAGEPEVGRRFRGDIWLQGRIG